jgi:hypothetical protein
MVVHEAAIGWRHAVADIHDGEVVLERAEDGVERVERNGVDRPGFPFKVVLVVDDQQRPRRAADVHAQIHGAKAGPQIGIQMERRGLARVEIVFVANRQPAWPIPRPHEFALAGLLHDLRAVDILIETSHAAISPDSPPAHKTLSREPGDEGQEQDEFGAEFADIIERLRQRGYPHLHAASYLGRTAPEHADQPGRGPGAETVTATHGLISAHTNMPDA